MYLNPWIQYYLNNEFLKNDRAQISCLSRIQYQINDPNLKSFCFRFSEHGCADFRTHGRVQDSTCLTGLPPLCNSRYLHDKHHNGYPASNLGHV